MTAKDLYENCRAWLLFAETKNGFALAFCGAAIAGEVSLLSGVEPAFKPFVLFSILFTTVAAMCSLLSFIPRLDAISTANTGQPCEGIVYFGHIAQRDSATFVTAAARVIGVEATDTLSLELLEQSHSLSVITVRKLRMFYVSVAVAGFGIIFPLVAAVAQWIC